MQLPAACTCLLHVQSAGVAAGGVAVFPEPHTCCSRTLLPREVWLVSMRALEHMWCQCALVSRSVFGCQTGAARLDGAVQVDLTNQVTMALLFGQETRLEDRLQLVE